MVILCKPSFAISGPSPPRFPVFLISGFTVFVCPARAKYNLKDADSSWDTSSVGAHVYMSAPRRRLDSWELASCGESDSPWFVSSSRVCVDAIFAGARLLRRVRGFFGLTLCWGMLHVRLGVQDTDRVGSLESWIPGARLGSLCFWFRSFLYFSVEWWKLACAVTTLEIFVCGSWDLTSWWYLGNLLICSYFRSKAAFKLHLVGSDSLEQNFGIFFQSYSSLYFFAWCRGSKCTSLWSRSSRLINAVKRKFTCNRVCSWGRSRSQSNALCRSFFGS